MALGKRRLARSAFGLQRLDEPALGARAEVPVLVGALLGPVPELGLYRLHGLAARHCLARHRMPLDLVVAERSESELLLHELLGPDVAVDAARKCAGLGEQKLRTGVSRRRAPVHGCQNVLHEIEHVRFVVLARDEFRFSRLGPALHRWIDDEPWRLPSKLTMRDCVHLPRTQPEPLSYRGWF